MERYKEEEGQMQPSKQALEGREHEEERRHRVGRHEMYHGTTTCSFVFKEGILVAVDSRASMGGSPHDHRAQETQFRCRYTLD